MSMHIFEFNNLKFAVFDDVYEPAEDSFLLAKYAMRLKGNILELGSGCGLASISNAKSNPKNHVLAVDINKSAVDNAKHNAKMNNIKNIKISKSNLFSNVRGRFNYIIFNPPYLPTTKNQKLKTNLNFAFDGGASGNKVIDKFLKEVDKYLKPNGRALMVVSSLNLDVLEIPSKTFWGLEPSRGQKGFRERVKHASAGASGSLPPYGLEKIKSPVKNDFQLKILDEESFFFEKLYLLQLCRRC